MWSAITGVLVILSMDVCFCFHCKDPSEKPVDWYLMYKVPRATREMSKKTTGREFYYMDAANPTWSYKDVDIQKPDQNPLYHTLQQIYAQNPDDYVMYNDECPPSDDPMTKRFTAQDSLSRAHMKGAYAFKGDTGFWLILSVPQFPAPRHQKYSYGQTQIPKAQSILCVTLNRGYLKELGKILDLTKPIYCDGRGPVFERLLVTNMGPSSGNKTLKVDFKSVGGQAFREFAKAATFGLDLYDSFVAEDLQDNLDVETWHPDLNSTCGRQKVFNVRKLEFADKYWFPYSIDHAKWAVTENKEWACIGDINRSKSQFKRGGGTMCLRHARVANQFKEIIKEKQKCKKVV